MKILIVEDEIKTGEYLRQGFREAGFNADLVRTGVDGLHMAQEGDHDLIILDVMLPGMDGWQVLKSLRRNGQEMPVLFLTAKDHVDDRIKGLELGADDYLVKPFSFAELLARVRTILRRGRNGTEVTVLQVADLELDLLRRRVIRSAAFRDGQAERAHERQGAGDDEDADDPVDELVERVVAVGHAVALLAQYVHADADQRDDRDDQPEGLDPSERGAHRAGESRRKACLRVREVGEDHAVCGGGCDVFKHHFSF